MKNIFFLLLFALISVPTMKADEARLLEIADVLKEVESNNNPNAIGDGGDAFGVLQIHKGCIVDVNRHYGTNYTHEDALDPVIAEDIFVKYLSLGIKLYKEKCGVAPTDKQLVRMWNGGIYKGYLYTDTIPYLQKYLTYKEIINENKILVSDMPKFLTRQQALSKFELEFLPQVKKEHGENKEEHEKAWAYFKNALYDSAMINTGGLNWKYPTRNS